MADQKKFERLPTNVRPELYDLYLKPNFDTFRFDGKVTILLKITESTNKIILNCLDLNIQFVRVKMLSVEKLFIPKYGLSIPDETLSLEFQETLPISDAELDIHFTGELNDKMKGFYRSKYSRSHGEKEKFFAVTMFAATDARRCFPCWDEPAIKARFDVTLAVDRDKVALSNMPVETESQIGDGLKVVKFCRTPIMSTYLVAFFVGDFEYVEDTSSDGILIRVYAPRGKKDQGKFALFVASKVLPFYREYFQIAYPLPKMDFVAVSEMSAGAMENWGLVTYREARLLVDEGNSSAVTKQVVAIIVGHELAHQWFGNLVTMEWWTHLWLNEGYASFVEFLCVAYLFPEYDIWTQFATDIHCCALEMDALENSHPIEIPINHPAEVEEIFDDISYKKGASIIRMLYTYIGDNDFKKGMNLYLTRHQYGNAFTEDLWAALEEASLKPIKTIMPSWTKQMGFPLITVENSTQENNDRILFLSQKKFCATANQIDDDSLWTVPLSFCKESKPTEVCHSIILSSRQTKVTIPDVGPDEWIKLNPNTVGFYRSKYPADILKEFVAPIKTKTLPPLDRLGLADDLFALIRAGQASTIAGFDLILAMKEEDNYTVWSNIGGFLDKVHHLLCATDFGHLFNAFGLEIMKPIYNKLGCENKSDENHLTSLLRSLVLNKLVKFQDSSFASIAFEKFEQHCQGTCLIPADLRDVIYRAVMSHDGKRALTMLLNLYRATDMLEERDRILRSFSAVTDVTLVDDILNFSQSEEVTSSYAVVIIISLASSKVGRDKSWEFVKKNYDCFREKYSGGFLLWRLIKYTTENYASEERAQDIELFFADKPISGIERTIQQSLETVRNNAAWLLRDRESIKNYLENFSSIK